MKNLLLFILVIASTIAKAQTKLPKEILNLFSCAPNAVIWYEFQPARLNSPFLRSILLLRTSDENILYFIEGDSCKMASIPNSKKKTWYIIGADEIYIELRSTDQRYEYTYNCSYKTFGRVEKIKKFQYKWDLDTEH